MHKSFARLAKRHGLPSRLLTAAASLATLTATALALAPAGGASAASASPTAGKHSVPGTRRRPTNGTKTTLTSTAFILGVCYPQFC